MVSHKHKCIFVHVPKAAGTSIERFFMEDLGIDMDNRHALLLGASTNKQVGPRRVSHLSALNYVDLHFISQELFDDYFKFAFVRNPLDKLFSTFKYWKFDQVTTFDYFILKILPVFLQNPSESYFVESQYSYLYDSNGNCLVDKVGKLENIEEDFGAIKKTLGLDQVVLKHFNKSSGKSFKINFFRKMQIIFVNKIPLNKLNFKDKRSKQLSKEAIDYIHETFKLDFTTFNYPYIKH